MRRHLWLVVEKEGRESFMVIHSKLMSAQPRSILGYKAGCFIPRITSIFHNLTNLTVNSFFP